MHLQLGCFQWKDRVCSIIICIHYVFVSSGRSKIFESARPCRLGGRSWNCLASRSWRSVPALGISPLAGKPIGAWPGEVRRRRLGGRSPHAKAASDYAARSLAVGPPGLSWTEDSGPVGVGTGPGRRDPRRGVRFGSWNSRRPRPTRAGGDRIIAMDGNRYSPARPTGEQESRRFNDAARGAR